MNTVARTGKSLNSAGTSAGEPDRIDIEGIWTRTDVVLSMDLSTTTREDMGASHPAVVNQLSSLLNPDLGQDEDRIVQGLVRKGRGLIEHGGRPTNETPAFGIASPPTW